MPSVDVEKAFKESLGDIERIDDGKYLYRFFTGKFDIDKFNREFDQYKENRIQDRNERQQNVLDELNKPNEEPPVYNQPVGTIFIRTKDALLNILDDLLKLNISQETFTKDNRLFYMGITIVFISILLFLFLQFISEIDKQPVQSDENKMEIVHKIKFDSKKDTSPIITPDSYKDLKWFDQIKDTVLPQKKPLINTPVSIPTPRPTVTSNPQPKMAPDLALIARMSQNAE